jgi:3-hydroxymyristoyl/3-hydroxydecanoyl-(acyl carrier protein) dehydratase
VELRVESDASLLVRSAWVSATPHDWARTADRVQLAQGQTFRHLGRADSVVKVGGRRVELGELEARLCAVTGVRAARVVAAETGSLRGTELLAVVEGDAVAVDTLKRALAPHVDPVVMPRRFRIVSELPRNTAGKISKAALLALFDVWQLESEELKDGTVRVAIPPALGYFRGHFPGQPVLAGVVQLERIALQQARRRWPDLAAVARVTRVKFKRQVTPGGDLVLTLQRTRPLQVQFALAQGSEPASSGILHFRGADAEDGADHA